MLDLYGEEESEALSILKVESAASRDPQFKTAELSHIPGTEICAICSERIRENYFRVHGQMACSSCAERENKSLVSSTRWAGVRTALFSTATVSVGIAILTATTFFAAGYEFVCYFFIAWIAGKALLKASGNLGGQRYQILAAVLTYLAVALASIPIQMIDVSRHSHEHSRLFSLPSQPADGSSAAGLDQSHDRYLGHIPAVIRELWMALISPFPQVLLLPIVGSWFVGMLVASMRVAYWIPRRKMIYVDGPYRVSET